MFPPSARRVVCLILFLLTGCTAGTPPADVHPPAAPSPLVHSGARSFQVGLTWGAGAAVIDSRGPVAGEHIATGSPRRWKRGSVTFSTTAARGAVLISLGTGGWRLRAFDENHPLRFEGRTYRGALVVRAAAGGGLAVVNEINVDHYLKGVLPRESVPTWPVEALKAQAVTSRTYLASHPMRHRADAFDVCASTHCQMYIGRGREDRRTNRAVDETADEILFYAGRPSMGYFYSSCGGMTETADAVWWNSPIPYLQRKECRWGADASWYRWEVALTGSDILTRLKRRGFARGAVVKDIRVTVWSPSKRAAKIRIETDAGAYEMAGDRFRNAMNGDRLRSTLFRLSRDAAGNFVFAGTGWGHGVGLCQWGSRGQAEEGRTYREILDFYFPGTALGKWARPETI